MDTSCVANCDENVKVVNVLGINSSSNRKCFVLWANSSISINNHLWQPIKQFSNDSTLIITKTASSLEGLYIKVS